MFNLLVVKWNGPPRLSIRHHRAVHKRYTMLAHCNLKQYMCLHSSLFSFYTLPSGGKSKDAVVHWRAVKTKHFLGQEPFGHSFFFKKWAIPGLFFIYFRLFNTVDNKQMLNKILPMTGVKPQTSCIESDRSTNWATTTSLWPFLLIVNYDNT